MENEIDTTIEIIFSLDNEDNVPVSQYSKNLSLHCEITFHLFINYQFVCEYDWTEDEKEVKKKLNLHSKSLH